MRDVTAWRHGIRASGDAPVQALDDDRTEAMFVCSTTELGPVAEQLASELGFPRSPFIEDGNSGVAAETSGRITDAGIRWGK